jgi:hypothetical protein
MLTCVLCQYRPIVDTCAHPSVVGGSHCFCERGVCRGLIAASGLQSRFATAASGSTRVRSGCGGNDFPVACTVLCCLDIVMSSEGTAATLCSFGSRSTAGCPAASARLLNDFRTRRVNAKYTTAANTNNPTTTPIDIPMIPV